MEETGYEDCFFGEGVTLVEWADRVRELMPENTIRVQIDRDPEKGFDYRRITVDYTGS